MIKYGKSNPSSKYQMINRFMRNNSCYQQMFKINHIFVNNKKWEYVLIFDILTPMNNTI